MTVLALPSIEAGLLYTRAERDVCNDRTRLVFSDVKPPLVMAWVPRAKDRIIMLVTNTLYHSFIAVMMRKLLKTLYYKVEGKWTGGRTERVDLRLYQDCSRVRGRLIRHDHVTGGCILEISTTTGSGHGMADTAFRIRRVPTCWRLEYYRYRRFDKPAPATTHGNAIGVVCSSIYDESCESTASL